MKLSRSIPQLNADKAQVQGETSLLAQTYSACGKAFGIGGDRPLMSRLSKED